MHKLEFEAIYLTVLILQAAMLQPGVNGEAGTSVPAPLHTIQSVLNSFKYGKEKIAFNFSVLIAVAAMYGVFTN